MVIQAAPSVFESDAPLAHWQYAPPQGLAALLARLADLACSPATPTPFALALVAPAGGGKTSALGWLTARVGAHGGANGGLAVVRLEAAELAAEPESALAAGLFRALAPTHGALVAALAGDADDFGADPATLARSARDRLGELRDDLIAQRQALAELQARRAALSHTALYEQHGSKVDTYARRMAGAYESRMLGFGLTGDSLTTLKHRTRDLAAHDRFPARLLASLRSVYAYRGQAKLLLYAALLFVLGHGVAWLAQRVDWLGILATASTALSLLALACLGVNLWRAYGFAAPVLRAAHLLDKDVAARARELDQAIAQKQSSVDLLAAEAAALEEKVGAAQQLVEAAGASNEPPVFMERESGARRRDPALGFLQGLSAALKEDNARLIVAIDGFEKITIARGEGAAGALFERLGDLLAQPGFIAVFALDPALCASETHARLLQVPLRLDVDIDPPAFAPLDAPLSPREERLLAALTPLAGNTPRAKKRLRNAYAFLRPEGELAVAVAFCLAVALGDDPAERKALQSLLTGANIDIDVAGAPRLAEFMAMAQEIGGPIDFATLRRASELAGTLVR
jgi:hypothetical protein